MNIVHGIGTALWSALWMAFAMFWEILWPLILGFTISGAIQAVVSKTEMVRLLGNHRPATLARACGLGAASSSCSYAAVAIARSIFRKGADFTASMAFELASTNLVLELLIILIVFLGWQFAVAEFVAAPLMVVVMALLFRWYLSRELVDEARAQADRGVAGKMEGHAAMDMSVTGSGSLRQRIMSPKGITAISHYFVMDWVSVWKDIAAGLVIAGALAAWVPKHWWADVFLTAHPTLATVWGPVIGPVIAVLSFVCSVGNIPLAAVLWNGGISFGGVLAFILADLIVLPILDIYRKYYGWRMMWVILGTCYVAMAGASLVVELIFNAFGLVPVHRAATVLEAGITLNYTTVLDIIFLGLAALLVWRFFHTGGPRMLRMMDMSPDAMHEMPAMHGMAAMPSTGEGHAHGRALAETRADGPSASHGH
jgi:uncharacterized protein